MTLNSKLIPALFLINQISKPSIVEAINVWNNSLNSDCEGSYNSGYCVYYHIKRKFYEQLGLVKSYRNHKINYSFVAWDNHLWIQLIWKIESLGIESDMIDMDTNLPGKPFTIKGIIDSCLFCNYSINKKIIKYCHEKWWGKIDKEIVYFLVNGNNFKIELCHYKNSAKKEGYHINQTIGEIDIFGKVIDFEQIKRIFESRFKTFFCIGYDLYDKKISVDHSRINFYYRECDYEMAQEFIGNKQLNLIAVKDNCNNLNQLESIMEQSI